MRTSRNILLLVLALLMAWGLGACQSQGSGTTAAPTTRPTSAAPGQTTQSPPDTVQDLGEIYVLRGISMDSAGVKPTLEYIREQAGVLVNIVWDDGTSGTDKFALMISSDEAIDFANCPMTKFSTYLSASMIMALDEYVDEYGANLTGRIRSDLWNWAKDGSGKTYGVPLEQVACVTSVTVRQDWLDALDLEAPKTVDDMEELLTAMKEAYDTAPLLLRLTRSGRHYDAFLGGAFLPDGWSWWKSDDGTYLPPEMHPEYKTLLETLRRWYENGLMDSNSLDTRGNGKALIEADKVGVVMDSWCLGQLFSRDAVGIIEGLEWVDLPALTGKYSLGNYTAQAPGSCQVVSVKSKNPQGVIAFLDWIAADLENTIVSRRGLRGVNWDYVNPDGEKPTQFVDSPNHVVVLESDTPFTQGALEFLDINNFVEYADTDDPYLVAANNWWEIDYGKAFKTYKTLDDQYQVVEGQLSCASQIADCNRALEEMVIAIVTGTKDLAQWDEWIAGEYQTIGMAAVIAEKNQVYAEKIK